MRLLSVEGWRLQSFNDENERPPYAIFSHRWQGDELQYRDIELLDQPGHAVRNTKHESISKLANAKKNARELGFKWIWCDTCCIDSSSSSELTEAINSMYAWYAAAAVCIAYIGDQDKNGFIQSEMIWKEVKNGKEVEWAEYPYSEWFERGWTLQELIAPLKLRFYDRAWIPIGWKHELYDLITRHTGIPSDILRGERDPRSVSIAMRLSWAADRKVTKKEDIAYSLLGLFNVNMPLLYGEGEAKAFIRLQEQIMTESLDHSIFAWTKPSKLYHGLLADSPSAFKESRHAVGNNKWMDGEAFAQTNRGLSILLHLRPVEHNLFLAALNCKTTNAYYGIYLRKLGDGQQFARTMTEKLPEVESDPPEAARTLIYVRQTVSSFDHKSADYHFLVPRNLNAPGFRLLQQIYWPLSGLALVNKPKPQFRDSAWLVGFDDNGYILAREPFRVCAMLPFHKAGRTLYIVFATTQDLEPGFLVKAQSPDYTQIEQELVLGHARLATTEYQPFDGRIVGVTFQRVIDYPRCLYVADILIMDN